MAQSLVTVLMPVYNVAPYLREAMDSILNQTYTDFEFLIINDGSTDETDNIIKSYNDPRIVYIKNETNLKLISTLNKGIELAKGKYIVRMDGDDISLPTRIELQVKFMEGNDSIGLGGTFIRSFGGAIEGNVSYSTTHEEIKFKLLFDTHFPHPTAIIRKQILLDHHLRFEHKYIHCEDFAMWNNMAKYTKIAIMPDILVLRRVHQEQISTKYRSIQSEISFEIRKELLELIESNISSELLLSYDNFMKGSAPMQKEETIGLLRLFERLIHRNRILKIYDTAIFDRFFYACYWNLCLASTTWGPAVYKEFNNSSCSIQFNLSLKNKSLLLIKCLLRYKDRHFKLPVWINESA